MADSFRDLLGRVDTKIRVAAKVRAARLRSRIDAADAVRLIRNAARISQAELAGALGVKQPAIAKMERQADMKLSTLMAIVDAAGGSMEIRVKLPNQSLVIG